MTAEPETAERVLILGEPGGLAEALVAHLARVGSIGTAVAARSEDDLAEVLGRPHWTSVAVLTHDDVLALRLTLLCAHLRADLPLWVTVFDKTTVHRLREVVPAVNVVPSAALIASDLADHCSELAAPARSRVRHGLRLVDDALRLLVLTGTGLLVTLAAQATISILALHEGFADALYFSTRSVATVADAPRSAQSPTWFKLSSAVITVIALVLVAVFTAALVRRLSRPRLTALLGRRSAPGHGHVLIVGFGQIGFRLAEELRRRRIPVIAVDRSADAPCVRLARRAGIPVAVGRGDDRATLELLGVRSCAAVAAVTSDDLVNVAVGLAASDVRPGVALVLRVGDGEVAAETESLLHLGHICDSHALTAAHLVRAICGRPGPD
jgi:voltage-gated potassium channel Kch